MISIQKCCSLLKFRVEKQSWANPIKLNLYKRSSSGAAATITAMQNEHNQRVVGKELPNHEFQADKVHSIAKDIMNGASDYTVPSMEAAIKALSYRIGIESIPFCHLKDAFAHPSLPHVANKDENHDLKDIASSSAFNELYTNGKVCANLFVSEYITARFPRLPEDSKQVALAVYSECSNVAAAARSFGIEYAIIPFIGIPQIAHPRLIDYVKQRYAM